MGTAKEGTIIPLGKNVMLMDRTIENGPGVFTRRYVSEADIVHTICTPSAVTGTYYLRIYRVHGDASFNETLVTTTASSSDTTPQDLGYLALTGTFKVEIHYTNSITLQLNGTGLREGGSPAVSPEITAVNDQTAVHQNELICLLTDMRDHLHRMNNHLRFITSIKEDEGKEY